MENKSFCQRVIMAADARAGKVAMTLIGPGGAETTTFGEMLSQIRGIAYRLIQEQIGFGDRVALIGENHPHWAIAYLGVLYRGAVVAPLDQAATVEALAHYIDDSEAKLAFVSPSSLDKFRAVCERLGRRIPAVILRDGAQANDFARFEDWARTPRTPEFDAAPPPARPDDVAVLMYTSGTTGTPKAVPLTHGAIFAESDGVENALRVTHQEVVLSLLPLFHAYSQVVNLWVATIIGARVVYITELSSAEIERGLKEGARQPSSACRASGTSSTRKSSMQSPGGLCPSNGCSVRCSASTDDCATGLASTRAVFSSNAFTIHSGAGCGWPFQPGRASTRAWRGISIVSASPSCKATV